MNRGVGDVRKIQAPVLWIPGRAFSECEIARDFFDGTKGFDFGVLG